METILSQFDSTVKAAATPTKTKKEIEASTEKPRALAVNPDGIPAELKALPQWVVWNYVRRQDKQGTWRWTKVPVNPRTGANAKANDPTSWGTYDEALQYHLTHNTDGIGYEFAADDPFCGIDQDDDAEWRSDFSSLDSYAEKSPSETGTKIFVKAKKPGARCKAEYKTGEVEIYDQGHFFVVTGHRIEGTPATVNERQKQLEEIYFQIFPDEQKPKDSEAAKVFQEEINEPFPDPPAQVKGTGAVKLSDDELLKRASAAKNGDRFVALFYNGDTSAYNGDNSAADMGLANFLRFWCGPYRDRIDRLFRQSKLMRPKWDERHYGNGQTYGQHTIDKALEEEKYYCPPESENGKAEDHSSTPDPQNADSHESANFTFTTEDPRRTQGGKVTVRVRVFDQSGKCVCRCPLSDSTNGRREAIKQLSRFAPKDDLEAIVDKMLVEAADAIEQEQKASNKGPKIADILQQKVPQCFDLVFRCTRGAYSDKRGEEVTAADFGAFYPGWLLRECEQAIDCPRRENGEVNRLLLIKTIRAELGGLWSTIVEKLPPEEAANIGPASPAAKRFKRVLVEVLTGGIQFEIEKTARGTSATVTAARTSIVERIRHDSKDYAMGKVLLTKREPWRRVQTMADVWWKPAMRRGKVMIVIGLRWRIGFQVKPQMNLPGAHDQQSFLAQCRKSGLTAKFRLVRNRLNDGERLVILSPRFVRELFALPK
jgi:hypothetical protein